MNSRRVKPLVPFLIVAASGTALVIGWRAFWFLTDDAFIAFRYAYNHMIGQGYVWNPAPFLPVEGYTSFLWVVLMEWIWRLTGVEPPEASNVVSLIFSFAGLLIGAAMMFRLRWREELCANSLVALSLLGVLTNRTFLAWTSSGLETAMFNFFVLTWVYATLYSASGTLRWCFLTSLSAAGIYLTRPDGLLFVGATLVLLATTRWGGASARRGSGLIGVLPLFLVPLHLVWRRSFYGEWLPNTYFAKHTAAWPESGVRYLASFVLEYALWVWILLGVFVLLHLGRRVKSSTSAMTWLRGGHLVQAVRSRPRLQRRVVVCLALALHASYYTFVIGGDHFEYRVYSYWVVLSFVSFLWALNQLPLKQGLCVGLLALQLVASWPIPWVHWQLSQARVTRAETRSMWLPVSGHFPAFLRPYAEEFDRLQLWLTRHYVCSRHQEHKIAFEWWLRRQLPSRQEGLELSSDALPVFFGTGGIGGLGWVLPHVNVIDGFGLNDYVIARYRGDPRPLRKMAHERMPPPGYVSCFKPNVRRLPDAGFRIEPRQEPLTAEDVRRCEQHWRAEVDRDRREGPAAR